LLRFLDKTTIDSATDIVLTAGQNESGINATIASEEQPPAEAKVTFNANGGSSVAPINVTIGQKIGTLPASTKSGYTLDGWYNGQTKFTADTIVTESVTLTAKWTAVPDPINTVTFDSKGGSAVKAIKVSEGKAIGTLPAPTKKGLVFNGWYIGTTKITATYAVTGNVTLTANWRALTTAEKQKAAEEVVKNTVPKSANTKATVAKKSATVKIKAVSGAVSYKIRYKVKGTKKWKTKNITKAQAKKGVKIKSLKSGKTYEIQYSVVKKAGTAKKKVASQWSKSKVTKKIK
jgi:uncharacterized repeat protein (TIGR02543 family)